MTARSDLWHGEKQPAGGVRTLDRSASGRQPIVIKLRGNVSGDSGSLADIM